MVIGLFVCACPLAAETGPGVVPGQLRALVRARKSHRFLRISRNGSKSPDKYDSPLPLTFFPLGSNRRDANRSGAVHYLIRLSDVSGIRMEAAPCNCILFYIYIYLMAPQLFRKCLGLPPIMKD